jgi:hypothetical protein
MKEYLRQKASKEQLRPLKERGMFFPSRFS